MKFDHGGLRLSFLVVMKFGFSNAFVVCPVVHTANCQITDLLVSTRDLSGEK